ncbi:hypothetical protein FF011L_12470 [Roseimaritima multifibrata]|uniref:Uncharacterized protein n=1 Tax=Roseimaritima multifibrata TaxID=1930274 RepID=A0A517MCA1_9BACT|nr:hypothetical protein [Roseimaritima multifibrata]QDS92501.1 hypothetical protein FF011L_12470 [Roseimaritima multifibrata]
MTKSSFYAGSMELPKGIESRLKKYQADPSLDCERAADYRFACEYLLQTAQIAWYGECNFSDLEDAIYWVDRLTNYPIDGFPDSSESGLSPEDLDEIHWRAQSWYEVFKATVASNPNDYKDDPSTLKEVIRRETDFFNFSESESDENEKTFADIGTLDYL